MNSIYSEQLQEIIRKVDRFIYDDSIEVTKIASYVVGATMMRDDYWDIIEIHKDLEEFAELGLSTEAVSEEYAVEQGDIGYLRRAFERLKAKYCQESDVSDKQF